jgi:hypothetical protein
MPEVSGKPIESGGRPGKWTSACLSAIEGGDTAKTREPGCLKNLVAGKFFFSSSQYPVRVLLVPKCNDTP